jgi:thiol-disulfide isomerase/thioredoxin
MKSARSSRSSRSSRSARSARSISTKDDTNTILICVLVGVLILIGLFFIFRDNIKRYCIRPETIEGFESSPMELNNIIEKPNPRGNQLVLVLFYVDWCPHCVSTKPEWQNLVNKLNNKQVNGHNIKVQACNAEGTATEKAFASENSVQGYPTIKLLKENDVVEYNGARNAEALEEFIKNNAN